MRGDVGPIALLPAVPSEARSEVVGVGPLCFFSSFSFSFHRLVKDNVLIIVLCDGSGNLVVHTLQIFTTSLSRQGKGNVGEEIAWERFVHDFVSKNRIGASFVRTNELAASSTKAPEHERTRAHGHGSTRLHGYGSTGARDHESPRAKEHGQSTTAREHENAAAPTR